MYGSFKKISLTQVEKKAVTEIWKTKTATKQPNTIAQMVLTLITILKMEGAI